MTIVGSFQVNGKQEPTVIRSFSRTPRLADFLITMKPLNVTRKIDSVGRIVIPKALRAEYRINEGVEYPFFLHEESGEKYLCIKCPGPTDEEIETAKQMLEESGFTVIEDE